MRLPFTFPYYKNCLIVKCIFVWVQLYIFNESFIDRLICAVKKLSGLYFIYVYCQHHILIAAKMKAFNAQTPISGIDIIYPYPVFSKTSLFVTVFDTKPLAFVYCFEDIPAYAVHCFTCFRLFYYYIIQILLIQDYFAK